MKETWLSFGFWNFRIFVLISYSFLYDSSYSAVKEWRGFIFWTDNECTLHLYLPDTVANNFDNIDLLKQHILPPPACLFIVALNILKYILILLLHVPLFADLVSLLLWTSWNSHFETMLSVSTHYQRSPQGSSGQWWATAAIPRLLMLLQLFVGLSISEYASTRQWWLAARGKRAILVTVIQFF